MYKFVSTSGDFHFTHSVNIYNPYLLKQPHRYVGSDDDISIAWDRYGRPSHFMTIIPDEVLTETWKTEALNELKNGFTQNLVRNYRRKANKTLLHILDCEI